MPFAESHSAASVPSQYVRSSIALALSKNAENLGIESVRLLSEAGIMHGETSNPEGRIARFKVIKMWELIGSWSKVPFPGIVVGSHITTHDLGLLGYILRSCQTLAEAIRKFSLFTRLLADDFQIQFGAEGVNVCEIKIPVPLDLIALKNPVHGLLAMLISVMREITGEEIQPSRVFLPGEEPEPDYAFMKDYFGCPVSLGAGQASIWLKKRDLELRLPSQDEVLLTYLDDHAGLLLQSFPKSDQLKERVNHVLSVRLIDGDPKIEMVANELGMSARSLQRRLSEAKTTFSEVLDEFRAVTARKLLANPSLQIKEICQWLGYLELSSFYRAFHRWESCPPRQFRAKLQEKS